MSSTKVKNKFIRFFFIYLILILFAIFTLFPFYWIFNQSIKNPKDTISYPPKFTFKPTISNYQKVLSKPDFIKSFKMCIRDRYYDAPKYDQERWTEPLAKFILDPDLTDLKWYDWDDFYLPAQKMLTIGNTAGDRIAITAEVQSLVYRKDMIAEAGVTVPDTFDELLVTTEKINGALKDRYGVVIRGNTELWWPLYGIMRSYGGEMCIRDSQISVPMNIYQELLLPYQQAKERKKEYL